MRWKQLLLHCRPHVVPKSQAGWDVCSKASTSMRERVSAAALLSWQMSDIRGELRNEVQIPGLPRGVLVQTGGESKCERLVV